jgi:hypothetical protein
MPAWLHSRAWGYYANRGFGLGTGPFDRAPFNGTYLTGVRASQRGHGPTNSVSAKLLEEIQIIDMYNYQTIKEIHMNKTLMSIVLFFGFTLLVGLSVASYADESVGNVVDDTVITTTVKAELAKDVRLATLTDIEVSTTQGVVTLAGKVHNSEEKGMVEQKVRSMKGVVKVINELHIVSP